MGIGIAGGDGEENLCAIGSPFRFSVLLKGKILCVEVAVCVYENGVYTYIF